MAAEPKLTARQEKRLEIKYLYRRLYNRYVGRYTNKEGIVNLVKLTKKIIKIICQQTSFSYQLVRRWVLRFRNGESSSDRLRTGRPEKLPLKVQEQVLSWIEDVIDDPNTAKYRVACRIKKEFNIRVSPQTITRIFRKHGIKSERRRFVPWHTKGHQRKRLRYAKENVNRDWSNVLFQDESHFELFGKRNRARCRVWTKNIRKIPPVMKKQYPEKHKIWGVIGMGFKFYRTYEGTVNADQHIEFLGQMVAEIKKQFPGKRFLFIQDGASCHCARKTQAWLKKQKAVLDFFTSGRWGYYPAYSPDFNPIEKLWSWLKDGTYGLNPKTLNSLEKCFQRCWKSIPDSLLSNLIGGLRSRMQQVIEAKGSFPSHRPLKKPR